MPVSAPTTTIRCSCFLISLILTAMKRRRRLRRLGKSSMSFVLMALVFLDRGLPIQIALAYVLCQPFPTYPLIGPRLLSEPRTSLPALAIDLTPLIRDDDLDLEAFVGDHLARFERSVLDRIASARGH